VDVLGLFSWVYTWAWNLLRERLRNNKLRVILCTYYTSNLQVY
jgi:hypothetical protein